MRSIRTGGKLLAVAASLLFWTGSAHADPSDANGAPPAQTGFQLALRPAIAIPFGTAASGTPMSDALGPQATIMVDIGGKISPNLFIGAYLGGAYGGSSGALKETCVRYGVHCDARWARGGIMAQYNLQPDRKLNPWIGYGIGYEIGGSSGKYGRNSITNTARGIEFAHLLGGLDFRVQEFFGIGPFIDAALGLYDVAKTTVNSGGYVITSPPTDKSLHLWLILGVRLVMRP